MTDHGVQKQEQAPLPFWRRVCQQAVLGVAGALGATAAAWLKAWLEGHKG
jgi:hypothetical protein